MKANRLFTLLLIILIISTVVISCSDDSTTTTRGSGIERPYQPWVFRSVLDQNPRMITLALNNKLWAAYRTTTGGLYKAWRGEVLFDGPVYTNNHGPQPMSIGDAYVQNDDKSVWKLTEADGTEIPTTFQYKGHKVVDDKAVLMYELSDNTTLSVVRIEEEVETVESEVGDMIFQRKFTTSNLPVGKQIVLSTSASSIVTIENVKTSGQLTKVIETEVKKGSRSLIVMTADLVLNANATTDLNVSFVAGASIPNPHALGDEEDTDGIPEGARLIARNDCKTCHNKNVKTIGPAYVDVAKRYTNNEDNIKMLVAKVTNGGSGVWGSQIMNAHPDLSQYDITKMIEYVMSLDADTEGNKEEDVTIKKDMNAESPSKIVNLEETIPGAVTVIYKQKKGVRNLDGMQTTKAINAGIMPNFDNISGADFANNRDNFGLVSEGYLWIEKENSYNFRIWSDDGSRVSLNSKVILDNDGNHGTDYKEASVTLTQGLHPFKIEYFQGESGSYLSWNWKPSGSEMWMVVPAKNIVHTKEMQTVIGDLTLPMANITRVPGDGYMVDGVHPSFDLSQVRPETFMPKVGGMDFMSDGRMVVSTWDAAGSVFMLNNINAASPEDIIVTKIAEGLAEPLGLSVVDDEIYIMQKQELTKLVDNNNDGLIDEYQTICDDWQVSANFHEFGFGMAYKDGHFYAALATAIEPGGASTNPQIVDRGKCVKINKETGAVEFVASGFRTPNGVGIGYGGDIYVADNQGDWLPSSKIVKIQEGAFYGNRSVNPESVKDLKDTPPVVWLPQDEIGNSPSTPLSINVGPYKNQMIHGEVTHGGVKRVFVEEVDGQIQGSLFRFTQGIEAGVNRLAWGPDGALYIGGIGSTGNWGQTGKLWYGLQRLAYNEKLTFEMLAVRAKSNGMEIEFTEPLKEGDGWNPEDYLVKQWYYKPTINYGGPKMDEKALNVKSATVSEDRKSVFLEFDGLKDNHVVYIKLLNHFVSKGSRSLWSTETWYTMNKVPSNVKGSVIKSPYNNQPNELSESERAAGWKLLFDGKSTANWHNYGKKTVGSSWKIENGNLTLATDKKPDGGWQVADGGDLISDEQYENFELNLEWKIANCGNSGIMFSGIETEEYDYIWQTGPEMQILDNTCHPDTKFVTHRAGDLYDMIETNHITVKPAGEWNKVRIIKVDGEVEFWLNGYKVIEFTMYNEEWKEMISKSKFADWKGFGEATKGHLALQDHGDRIWFRNVKILEK